MQAVSHKKRVLCLLAGILVAVLVLAMASFGLYLMISLDSGIDDGYALWGAGEMVIEYLKVHGRMPRNWDDLQPQFSAKNGRVGGWSFGQFQDRIGIDFNADANELRRKSAESPVASFRVIWAKWDAGVRVGEDPNQMLCDYFRLETSGGHR